MCFVLAALQGGAQAPFYTGTKTPYKPQQEVYTAPPAGFTPVYINYVGRHGSRFLTKAGSDIRVQEVLQQAENAGGLSRTGKKIKAMTARFLTIERGSYENISLLGAAEQAAIGKRMRIRDSLAFTGKGLLVRVTHKIRTKQSADAFVSSFADYKGPADYEMVRDSDENELRFYDLSPAYLQFKKSRPVTDRTDSLEKDAQNEAVARAVAVRLFTPAYLKQQEQQGKSGVWAKLADDLYDLYSVQYSVPLEAKQHGYTADSINFRIAFKEKELAWMDFKSGASDFLEKGAGLDTLGVQVRIAAPLLLDFINTTGAAAAGDTKYNALLRFTHAEAISPFATLLGIPAASKPAAAVYSYQNGWQAGNIIPLSANIQWIIYSNGREQLVKVLLNEKEVALPLATDQYPYYHWKDVQAYYLNKLKVLGVTPGDNMHQYLQQLQ